MATSPDIKQQVQDALYEVIDPEMYISIIDLGLVYDVAIQKEHALITMTLTSLGCPLFSVIENDIRAKVLVVEGIEKVTVHLTFEPAWSVDRMTERGKATLSI